VAELSHDTAEDGFHEIQLSGKQLVFLFIVTTSVLVAVFLCGVLVGRGARDAGSAEPDSITAAAPAAQAVPDAGAAAGPPAAEPPAPAAETADDLSYHKRLQGTGAAPETIKPQAEVRPTPPPAVRSTPPPAASAPAAAGRPGTFVVQVIATRDQSVATSVVKRLSDKGYPAFLVNPAAGAAQPFFKVHVGRYNDRREAEQVSLRIKKEEQFQPWISR
jgi:cell division septation protein DedD